MFTNVERYVDFIVKNKLTQAQFLMLYLIYRKRYNCIIKYKEAFPSGDDTMVGEVLRNDLIKREFIKKVDENSNKADNYVLTDKFLNLFLQDKYEAMNQFWDIYPGFTAIDGKIIPLTNIDKVEIANIYAERIDFSVDEHKEVIKDLVYGVQNNLIKTKIETFVRSESWMKIREIRLAKLKEEVKQEDF